jgi:outer membrane receptor for ferrienterochelin and colicin
MSTIRVPVTQLKKIPAFLGETDILKAIQLLPGVQSGGEGQSGFYVRGGSQDQNLILLDGTPVYNASHLFGFFSVFNADAIKDVTLVKGGFPARYGGRLSSVLDISMKEGNMKEFHGSGSIGLVASKLTLEGPIWKDKISFIVSARRTYIDILARPFISLAFAQEEGTSGSFGYYFYDFNGKLNWKISPEDRVYFSVYSGDDVFYTQLKNSFEGSIDQVDETVKIGFGWGNLTSTLRWNHLWTDKLFSNTSLTYSRYKFNTENGFTTEEFENGELLNSTDVGFGYVSGINDVSAKIDFDYIPVPDHFIRFGGNLTSHVFIPGENFFNFNVVQEGQTLLELDSIVGQDTTRAIETYLYVEDDFEITQRLKANIGLHFSSFLVDEAQYHSLQPRISMRYLFDNKLSLKASFATMQQNIQFLTNENIGLPWDQWLPSTQRVVPQTSWQVAAGLAKTFKGGYEVSIEGYYKKMNNVSAYKEGASSF